MIATPGTAPARSAQERLWFPFRRPLPHAAARLFCFSDAGEGASAYLGWSSALGGSIEVCAAQLPGRETRAPETPLLRINRLAEELADAVTVLSDCPFALFGHGIGALFAYVVAQELRRRGAPSPMRLFVSGHAAPDAPARPPPTHLLPCDALIDELRRRESTRAAMLADPSLRSVLLPILRADLAVSESYRHATESPLAVPISAFGGKADPCASPTDLGRWRFHTRASFERRLFEGGHLYVRTERGALIDRVRRTLDGLH